MKKVLFITIFSLIFCNKVFAEDYYFKGCQISSEVASNYFIDIEKNLIRTTSVEKKEGSSKTGEYPILVITKNEIITKQIQSKTHKQFYLQIYLNAKNNSIGIQRLKKESENDIFRMVGKKSLIFCDNVKANWSDAKKEEKPEGEKLQEQILQVDTSLQNCEGNIKENWNNCKGKYISQNGSEFFGIFEDGKIIKGNALFPGGSKYVGDFESEKPHGQGTFIYPDGTKYVGEWRNGESHGNGIKTWKDGSKYVGKFNNDKLEGKGTFIYSDGSKYVGEFMNGKKHGKGTLTYKDGRTYIGQFVDGLEHGEGTCFNQDGSRSECKKKVTYKSKNTKSIFVRAKKWIKLSQYETSSGKGKKILDKLNNSFNEKAYEMCSSTNNYKVLEKRTEILEIDETPAYGLETVVKIGIDGVIECK